MLYPEKLEACPTCGAFGFASPWDYDSQRCETCHPKGEMMTRELHVIFDGPPGPEAGRFVEVETADGRSVAVGRWEERSRSTPGFPRATVFWHLILTPRDFDPDPPPRNPAGVARPIDSAPRRDTVAFDPVERPEHYVAGALIEPVAVIDDWELDFYLGQVVKYLRRHGKKPGEPAAQDLKKARWYLDRRIANLERKEQP